MEKKTAKHTPGPWNWDEMDGRIYITPMGHPCHYVADIGSKEIDPEGSYPTQARREANAALIAAAPDMLEIIKALAKIAASDCQWCESAGWWGDGHKSACVVRSARLVLAEIQQVKP